MTTTSFAPPVDIYEDDHNITLKLEVPGVDEKDIDVRIENTTLIVHGERKIEKEEKEENFRRIERQYGSFTRSFTLPSSVDSGHVSANYDNGVRRSKSAMRVRVSSTASTSASSANRCATSKRVWLAGSAMVSD